ncbi:hypothetical protein AGDE_15409 [Angomonas deanei]|nr:hypothetical protein AGDE_15409 [Angomonas deanei]|eukprot:EPY19134.1 hypothetical protein AGDE_15409 [Angomonas deanei]
MSNPSRFASAYRHCCTQSRHHMDRLTDPSVIGAALRSCEMSLSSTPRNSVARSPSHLEESPGVHLSQNDSVTMHFRNGLHSLRLHREHQLWCKWQLHHFYERGPSYLRTVWRPISNGSTLMTPEDLCGQYVLPCNDKIDALIAKHKMEQRRKVFFSTLLLKEFGLSEEDLTPSGTKLTQCWRGDDNTFLEEDNNDDASNASRRASRLAAVQPYLEITFDANTSRLHISIYINGEGDGGEGAEYFGSSVACCIDNFRWFIVEGKWKGKIIFFVPGCSPFPGRHTFTGIDSILIGHTAMKKLCRSTVTAEYMICKKCGNIAKKKVRANARKKKAYCILCKQSTVRLNVPNGFLCARQALHNSMASIISQSKADEKNANRPCTGKLVYEREQVLAAYLESLHILLSESAPQKPQWKPCKRVNVPQLFGPYPSLSSVPPKPKTPISV